MNGATVGRALHDHFEQIRRANLACLDRKLQRYVRRRGEDVPDVPTP